MDHLDSVFFVGNEKWKKIPTFNFFYFNYRKVVKTYPSHFEARAGLFRLLMKGIFDAYVLWQFAKKFSFELEMGVRPPDCSTQLF